MDEVTWNHKLKEIKSAKRGIVSAIRMFGPNNVTSILDRETFADKLAPISKKLKLYIEMSDELIEELEELQNRKTEAECNRRSGEINTLTDEIIKKVNDNECEVKRKIEEVIKRSEINRDSKTSSCQFPSTSKNPETQQTQSSRAKTTEKPQDYSILSNKMAEYCEAGPFLTHLPKFIYLAKYVTRQYQRKLPIFGMLLKPVLVGGAIDSTAGTLTAPDLDFNIEWELSEDLTRHLLISPTDEGESGQYNLQVKKGYENRFKSLFKSFVIEIQNHGKVNMAGYDCDKVNKAYVEKDSKTFLSSDLLRSQVGGLFELLKDGKSFGDFTPKDFSPTGAARTMALDVNKFFRTSLLTALIQIPDHYLPIFNKFVDDSCKKILPELEVDYTPVLTIPYDQVTADLKLWEDRDSWLLDHETKEKIKEAKGTLVAKSLEKDESRSSIIWRLSLNSAPVMQKAIDHFRQLEPKCSVRKVLRLIKDIKNVTLDGSDKDFLKSYNVKQAMLWCIDDNSNISTEADLLILTLKKIIQFYHQKTFPSFLEPKRNLTFKMSRNGQLEVAEKKVANILINLTSHLDTIKDAQRNNREGVSEVRHVLDPMADILLFPVVAERISEKTTSGLNKDIYMNDGTLHFFFEDTEKVEVLDKVTNTIQTVSERDRLKFVIKNWVDSVLIYVTKHGSDNEVNEEEIDDTEMPSGNTGATDFVHTIARSLPTNDEAATVVNQFAAVVVPSLAEAFPCFSEALPDVNRLANVVYPVILPSLFKFVRELKK